MLMSGLILLFRIMHDLGSNAALMLEEVGRIVCMMAGLDVEDERLCQNKRSVKERW